MKDLTQGSVIRHLLEMAAFMAVSMLVQTLYLLADMYWVGRLGKEAIAAVGVAGNLMMIVLGLTQMIGVGTTTVIAQAIGRKDQPRAERALNQSFVMSCLVGVALTVAAFAARDRYAAVFSADAATADFSRQYLNWFIPALALQFPLVTLGSAMRAAGLMKPGMIVQVLSVVLNIVFAPLFIFGLGPFPAMGVSGAALATFVSLLIADVVMVIYFERRFHYLRFRAAQLRPQLHAWWEMLRVGLPAGAEFALFACYASLVYIVIRPFGAAAQAGFGIGARVMQAMFLPVVALSFAVGPVVGQNFGGGRGDRVRAAVKAAIFLATGMMGVLTIVTWLTAPSLIRVFSTDPSVIAFGGEYLTIVALNFVASGIAFSSSSVFQGIGNTVPPLLSTASRMFLFALPVFWLSGRAGFQIRTVWHLSVVSQLVQAGLNLLLLRRELGRKLKFEQPPSHETPAAVAEV